MRRPILPPAPSSAMVVINHLVVSILINLTLANSSKAVFCTHLPPLKDQLQVIQRGLAGMSEAKWRAANQRACQGESFNAELSADMTGSVSPRDHNSAHSYRQISSRIRMPSCSPN